MSLILDALNRSRQDADPVPGLVTQHSVAPVAPVVRRYLPWFALFVAVLLIVWLVWERGTSPASAPNADVGAPVVELSRNIGSAVTSVATELKTRADVAQEVSGPEADAPEFKTVQEPAATSAPSPTPDSGGADPLATEHTAATPKQLVAAAPPAVKESAAVAELYQKQGQSSQAGEKRATTKSARSARAKESAGSSGTARAGDEQPVDIEAILRNAQKEMENASLAAHPSPFLESLSQQTKDSIPTIYYQRHDYSSQASRSAVVLNGKTLKVGGSPASGVKVDEILTDSVVLNYRGTQFRLRALNSWINL